jgi:hypothetical protein
MNWGQAVLQEFAHGRRTHLNAGSCNDVANEPVIARVMLSSDYDRMADCGMLRQHRFNLAWLDSKTANLHLVVCSGPGTRSSRLADSGP